LSKGGLNFFTVFFRGGKFFGGPECPKVGFFTRGGLGEIPGLRFCVLTFTKTVKKKKRGAEKRGGGPVTPPHPRGGKKKGGGGGVFSRRGHLRGGLLFFGVGGKTRGPGPTGSFGPQEAPFGRGETGEKRGGKQGGGRLEGSQLSRLTAFFPKAVGADGFLVFFFVCFVVGVGGDFKKKPGRGGGGIFFFFFRGGADTLGQGVF